MGWESRGNGRYYYRKVRYGDRVVSEYVGTGEPAEKALELAQEARAQAKRSRQDDQRTIQQADEADAELATLTDRLSRQIVEALERAGFHRHNGQWRRRRNARAQHGH